MDVTDAHAIRKQLDGLENMYGEVLKLLGKNLTELFSLYDTYFRFALAALKSPLKKIEVNYFLFVTNENFKA